MRAIYRKLFHGRTLKGMEKMSDRIKLACKRAGLTQAELCLYFGWPTNRLSRVRSKHVALKAEEVVMIARRLNVSPGWLIDDTLPDNPDVMGLPKDETDVLREYRRSRPDLDAATVVSLIAEERGRRLGTHPAIEVIFESPGASSRDRKGSA